MNAVYMLASGRDGTLYIGVTSDLHARIGQHREGFHAGFTDRYSVRRLVWFEEHDNIVTAIQRERRLKKYRREWKVNLIERDNREWLDLYPSLFRAEGPLSHLQPPTPAM